MDYGFTYAESNSIVPEEEYPYTAKDGKCNVDLTKGVVKVKSFVDVEQNEVAL